MSRRGNGETSGGLDRNEEPSRGKGRSWQDQIASTAPEKATGVRERAAFCEKLEFRQADLAIFQRDW